MGLMDWVRARAATIRQRMGSPNLEDLPLVKAANVTSESVRRTIRLPPAPFLDAQLSAIRAMATSNSLKWPGDCLEFALGTRQWCFRTVFQMLDWMKSSSAESEIDAVVLVAVMFWASSQRWCAFYIDDVVSTTAPAVKEASKAIMEVKISTMILI